MEKTTLKLGIGPGGWEFRRRIDNGDFLAPARLGGELAFVPRHCAGSKALFGFCAIECGVFGVVRTAV